MSSLTSGIGSSLASYNPNLLAKPVEKTANLASSSSSSTTGSSASNPLQDAFVQILEESVTGLAALAGRVAYKKAAEFVEDHEALGMFVKAAGWAPASGSSSGSSSSTSSTSSSSSSSSNATAGNDPITRLLTALGQTIVQNIEDQYQASLNTSTDSSTQTQSNGTDSTTT
jgi:hypothetical protein